MGKLNVLRIIADHARTLRDYRTGKTNVADWLIFFGSPLVLAALGWHCGGLKIDALNGLLAAFSIFAGLLLNLLVLLYTVAQSVSNAATSSDQLGPLRKQFLRELLANISFSIVTSIAVVVTCLIAIMLMSTSGSTGPFTNPAVTAFLAYLTANFLLTLLQIIKRVYALLLREFDRPILKRTA